ncbi:hypothetical protein ACFV9C_41540 [Kribbella sp. NPDC059898]|uniref:hypothetical protein n=1 Tax=Kribbella sp. NPDC059898 TaxID=3346995 RepID=UPI00365C3262
MYTTVRISTATREELARVARDELGDVDLDQALRIILFDRSAAAAVARMSLDPEELKNYHAEAALLAECDVAVWDE